MQKPKVNYVMLRARTDNPVKLLRQSLGMSIQAFSDVVEIPRTTTYFTENGAVANISDKIHGYFIGRFSNYSIEHVNAIFNDWVKYRRKIVKDTFTFPPVAEKITEEHPIRAYLEENNITIAKFCTMLAVPKNVIYHYMKHQETMPASLKIALLQCGMPDKDVRALDRAGATYYHTRLNERIEERRQHDERRKKAN